MYLLRNTARLRATVVVLAIVFYPIAAFANHGPGTSGGGASTISGETLDPGKFALTLRLDYTDFDDVSKAEAEQILIDSGEEHGHFDVLSQSYLSTLSVEYGLLEDLTLGAQVGYYHGDDFAEAHIHHDGSTGVHAGEVDGMTDLYLTAKYRLLKGRPGHLSVIGGVKAPTGKDDEELTHGSMPHPSSQPGTGAWDFQLGAAYSRFLTSRITLDASGLYTLRTEHENFRVGDRFDAGLALNYRLTESIRSFPRISVFGEVLYVWLDNDEDDGEKEASSGGDTIYLSPGVRVGLSEAWSIAVAPQVPIYQELNGDQLETDFKLAVSLTYSP